MPLLKSLRVRLPWLFVSLLVVVLDQWTKWLALAHLKFQQPWPVFPSVNFTLNFNPGAAFSFLSEAGGWQLYFFVGVSAILAAIIFIWLMRTAQQCWQKLLGLSLLLGGAVGNLIDRVRLSYVIDFIDFYIKNWHYATFNVADSAVCVGAFFLIWGMLIHKKT